VGAVIKVIHRIFHAIAWLMAVFGGAVLSVLVLMLCASIFGRTATSILHSAWMTETAPDLARWLLSTGIGPIYGDYEFLVAGLALSVFCFLGWCQITAGHATVDVFTTALRDRQRRILQMVIEILFAVALVLIALQLYDGLQTVMRRRSTTFMLQYPLWWNYLAAFVPAAITAAIGVWMALVRIAEAAMNRPLITVHGAEH